MSKDETLIRKTVGFNKDNADEIALYNYWENEIYKKTGDKFATYVKKLIRNDMLNNKQETNNLDELIERKLKKILSDNPNIVINTSENKEKKANYNKNDKKALLSFMGKK